MEKGYSLQYVTKANNYRITVPKAVVKSMKYGKGTKFQFIIHPNGKDLIMQMKTNVIY